MIALLSKIPYRNAVNDTVNVIIVPPARCVVNTETREETAPASYVSEVKKVYPKTFFLSAKPFLTKNPHA